MSSECTECGQEDDNMLYLEGKRYCSKCRGEPSSRGLPLTRFGGGRESKINRMKWNDIKEATHFKE